MKSQKSFFCDPEGKTRCSEKPHSYAMLSKHRHLHFMNNLITGNNSDSHFLSDKLPKPSISITKTSKSYSDIELARGISVVFPEKNSHLLLPHREVSLLQLTEVLRFGKPYSCSSSMASKDPLTDHAYSELGSRKCYKKTHEMKSVIIPYALDEIWSSEEYTCVVVHGDDYDDEDDDQKPAAVTHIFCDYILESCHPKWMIGKKNGS